MLLPSDDTMESGMMWFLDLVVPILRQKSICGGKFIDLDMGRLPKYQFRQIFLPSVLEPSGLRER